LHRRQLRGGTSSHLGDYVVWLSATIRCLRNLWLPYGDFSHGDFSHGDFSHGDFSYRDFSYGDFSYGDFSYGDFSCFRAKSR